MLCPSVGCSMVEVQYLMALDTNWLTSNLPLHGFKNPHFAFCLWDETEVAMILSQVKTASVFRFHVQEVDTTPLDPFGSKVYIIHSHKDTRTVESTSRSRPSYFKSTLWCGTACRYQTASIELVSQKEQFIAILGLCKPYILETNPSNMAPELKPVAGFLWSRQSCRKNYKILSVSWCILITRQFSDQFRLPDFSTSYWPFILKSS